MIVCMSHELHRHHHHRHGMLSQHYTQPLRSAPSTPILEVNLKNCVTRTRAQFKAREREVEDTFSNSRGRAQNSQVFIVKSHE